MARHYAQRGEGSFECEFFQQMDFLYCKITDDGIGRKKAAELKSKSAAPHKSLGMSITASRIALLKGKNNIEDYVTITDLVLADGSSGGTEVFLKIPVQL